jgi:hypothetical protein
MGVAILAVQAIAIKVATVIARTKNNDYVFQILHPVVS